MKRMLLFVLLLVTTVVSKAQDTPAVKQPAPHNVRHGPPVVASIVLLEACAAGFSWYAAQPCYYGDKVMGTIYGATGIGFLAVLQSEYRASQPFSEKMGNAVTMLGLTYGMSRLAVYNLTVDSKETSDRRVVRNFIEFNAAYIIPFAAGAITERALRKYDKKTEKRTGLYFTGNGIMLTVGL